MIPSSLPLPRKVCRPSALVILLLAISSTWTAGAAPGGPNVTVNDPVAVTLTGPVEVQGSVEVINDALKTPFNKRMGGVMSPTAINAILQLPEIPSGKRLVIEAIGITAYVAPNSKATAILSASAVGEPNNAMAVPLPLTAQGTFGLTPREYCMGLHNVRIVIDPRYVALPEINVFRSAFGDPADVRCTILGYLEDIPAVP
jgi:hypothetical protein